ncbi:hypothetical protein H8D51_02870 [bacterium]|nr:hypothetical protein [bacterium]
MLELTAPLWEWHFKPWQVLRVRTTLLALVILAVALVLVSNFGITMLAFLLLIAFTWSLRLALFTTRYRVNTEGLSRVNLWMTQSFPNTSIRRVVPVPGGIFVSQHRRPSRLDRFQGWLIPLPATDKKQIINHLQTVCATDQEVEA